MSFNPYDHSVNEVLEHCLQHPEEVPLIALHELDGKQRKQILQTLILDMGARLAEESDFEKRLRELHAKSPYIQLGTALMQVGGMTVNLMSASLETRAQWVLEQPYIMAYLPDRKINAIKEARAMSGMGLKEAKEAVEYAVVLQNEGYLTLQQRRQLEIDEKAAIASILGQ